MIRVEIVDKQFDEVLRQVMAQTNKTAAQVCNEKAVKVISFAIKETPVSNPQKIRTELGQVATALSFNRRTGKAYQRRGARGVLLPGESVTERGRLVRSGTSEALTIAHRIVLRDLWAKYKSSEGVRSQIKSRAELDDRAKRLIASRMARVGYLRAGWHAALDDAWNILRSRPGAVETRRDTFWRSKGIWNRGQRKILGRYRAALPEESRPFAIITNSATGQKDRQPHPEEGKASRIEAGLQRAFRAAVADMKQYMEEKLRKAYNKITGGRR